MTTGTPPGAPAAANPVTTQVVDRIAAMVTTTDSANRVTLKLQPEALGEVRIVLTVRDGAMQVQLSAHDAAARTLLENAPELRRMLDQLGAGDARVTVRDLGTQQAAAPGTPWSHDGTADRGDQGELADRGDQLEAGADRDNSNHDSNDRAGTPGRSTATDGTDVVTNSPRRTQSVGSHRSPGVDLTM